MVQIPKIELGPYVDIALRRKWWIVIPLVLSTLAGIGYLKITPKVYRASTLILVEPQSIPDSFVRSTVTESVESRLRTITQQVHSRTNLENVIREFGLDREVEKIDAREIIYTIRKKILGKWLLPRQEDESSGRILVMKLVERLRQDIKVTLRGSNRNQGFEITFDWHDPGVAVQVVNAIASRFIEENLNVREQIAVATTDFLEKETTKIRQELETREKKLEAFKREHMGMLPNELESNINILNQLKEEFNNLEKRLDTEKQMAMALESNIRMQKATAGPNSSRLEEGGRNEEGADSVEALEAELQALRSRYTDKHPDIVSLKRKVEAARKEKPWPAAGPQRSAVSPLDPLRSQQMMINDRIKSYETQIEESKNKIELYKDRVERTPQIEIEMTKILRDYETVQQRYNVLLSKKLDAKMSEELERRQKGEQFKILDPAVRPVAPFKPDKKKILLMAVIAGLGLGCGLAYLREVMDYAFYGPEEVESFLGTDVIISLPVADFCKAGFCRSTQGRKRRFFFSRA